LAYRSKLRGLRRREPDGRFWGSSNSCNLCCTFSIRRWFVGVGLTVLRKIRNSLAASSRRPSASNAPAEARVSSGEVRVQPERLAEFARGPFEVALLLQEMPQSQMGPRIGRVQDDGLLDHRLHIRPVLRG